MIKSTGATLETEDQTQPEVSTEEHCLLGQLKKGMVNMKKIANSVSLRGGTATALCLTFLIYLPLRVSSVGAVARAAADLKSESQFRSEASRYERAIRAIAGIATMKLETQADLKLAIAILDRERPNLKLSFSKLVVMAFTDSTFSSAVKKKIPDKQTAESFLRGLQADHKAVLKLDGAESLATRLRRSAESDAAILRRAGERLKEAAEKIKRVGQGVRSPDFRHNDEFKVTRVGFRKNTPPIPAPNTVMQLAEALLAGLFVGAVLVAVALYGTFIIAVSDNETGQALVECMEGADGRYFRCVDGADFFKQVECYTVWLLEQAACVSAVRFVD